MCVCVCVCRDTASCQLYDALVSYFAGTTASNRKTQSAARPTTGPLPWLYYGGNTYTQATDMGLRLSHTHTHTTQTHVQSRHDLALIRHTNQQKRMNLAANVQVIHGYQ